jgi:uncharacterized OsmC-like protein
MKKLINTPSRSVLMAGLLVVLIINMGMAKRFFTAEVKERIEPSEKMDVTSKARVNGFSIEDIMSTVKVLQEKPEIARFEFRAKNKWINGGHNRSTIKGFYGGGQEDTSRKKAFVYDNSEPPILLGNNEGANPVEYILHGLAGCMTTTMVLHAAANGIELKSVESSLEGDLDVQGFLGLNETIRNGYQQIRVKFTIEGDITEDQRKMLESFVLKSPVFDIVTNKVPVNVSIQMQ